MHNFDLSSLEHLSGCAALGMVTPLPPLALLPWQRRAGPLCGW